MAQRATPKQVVSSSTARYVPEPRRGYGHARNRGLAEARGRRHLLPGRRLRSGTRLVGRAVECSRFRRCRSRQRLPRSGPAGSCGAPGISLDRRPRLVARSRRRSRAPSVHFEPHPAPRRGRESRLLRHHAHHVRGSRLHHARAQARLPSALRTQGPRYALSRDSPALRLPGKDAPLRNRNVAVFPPLARRRTPRALCSPASPALRLLLLPALAAAGTAYLVARNLPQCPDAAAAQPVVVCRTSSGGIGVDSRPCVERQPC